MSPQHMVSLSNTNAILSQALNLLEAGELIAFPTETVYALACDATNPIAVQKLYALKGRNSEQPIAALVATPNIIETLAEIPEKYAPLLAHFMPGALTVILPKKEKNPLAENLNPGGKTIGIRCPNHALSQTILSRYPNPIAATSCNPSGAPAATSISDVRRYFNHRIPLVLENKEATSGIASTVLDLATSPPRILREGTLSHAVLKPFLEEATE